jgi:hypothetical protein
MKKRGTLVLVPFGGLANRMYAIASAYSTCLTNGSKLSIVWFREWGMGACFADLFEPLGKPGVALRQATALDRVVNDRPRRRNLFVPKLMQRLLYDRRIYENSVSRLRDSGFNFAQHFAAKRAYMVTCIEFDKIEPHVWAALFRPVRPVMEAVEARTKLFSAYTIGMHIRRSDNVNSIKQSPTRLFVEAGKREMAEHPDLKIFLATDSEEVKREMREAFGHRIITSATPASRDNIGGLRDGLVDMYTLSHTALIYGSWFSSFSEMAAKIGGKKLVVLRNGEE